MPTPIVEVLSDKVDLVQRALELVTASIQTAIAERGFCTLALAGGSTPKPLYAALATQPLAWDKLYIFWGDERYVPVSHGDSNAGMAKQVWLDRVPIPPGHILIPPTHLADPAEAAAIYADQVRSQFSQLQGLAVDQLPQFDLILLGMGDDGHTASLFPHTAALQVRDQLVTLGQKGNDPRLTFTVPLINQARCVIFLVAGAGKRPALAEVFAEVGDDQAYPSRLVRPQGQLYWLLDRAAGEELEKIP